MVRRAAAVLLAGVLVTAAHAQPSLPGSGVLATGAWSRVTPAGADSAAVYLTLKAPVRDRLVAVSTPQADAATVQRVTVVNEAAVALDIPGGLPLPPGQPVSLQPGGIHITLTGLHAPLQLGQTFPLRLTFAVSQPVEVVARVATIGAGTPPPPGTLSR